MSINTPSSSSEVMNQVSANVEQLPANIKEQVTQETQEELKFLMEDMQKISHEKFLADVPFADRLKHITDPNVDAGEVTTNSQIEFNFSFT
jgi:hypothetical protein